MSRGELWGRGFGRMRALPLAAALCCGCAGTTKQSGLGHAMRERIHVVVCKVFLVDDAPSAFTERFSAISFADDPTAVAETVGEQIVDEVLR